jgi:hypothetical protein
MRASTVVIVAALLGAGAIVPSPARSQAFACTATSAGQLSVQANVQCACRSFAASALQGTPAGYRWDCGILRARNNHEVPATASPYPFPLPAALSLERPIILPDRRPAPPPLTPQARR